MSSPLHAAPAARLLDRLRDRVPANEPWPAPPLALGATTGPVDAAVLAVLAPPDLLVFTHRRTGLPTHAGQISFPGGKPETGDADLAATALRETFEEVGLARASLELRGRLDPVATPSGFVIHPFVATWPRPLAPAELRHAPGEVERTYLVSLGDLAAPGRHRSLKMRRGKLLAETHEYLVPAVDGAGRRHAEIRIWGATGRMTWQLLDLSRA